MKPLGTFYGIGVGPGDPELLTLKAVRVLGACGRVVVPKSREDGDSVALEIAKAHVPPHAEVHELVFPMITDPARLAASWEVSGKKVLALLEEGDTCFLTLGDLFLYSTFIYLLRALRSLAPDLRVECVPGISAFSAIASLTQHALGEGKRPIEVIPLEDNLTPMHEAIGRGGTVILMKVGRRLPAILQVLEETGLIERAVLVRKAGQPDELVCRDLRSLVGCDPEVGYLSTILIPAEGRHA